MVDEIRKGARNFHGKRFPFRRISVAAILGAALVGCQLLLTDASEVQCSSNNDCRERGFSLAVCGPSGTCVTPADTCTSSADCPAQAGQTVKCFENKCQYSPVVVCTTDNECRQQFDGAYARCVDNRCEKLADDYCTTNSECLAKNDKSICIENKCTPLLSEDCTHVVGTKEDLAQDDVLVYGFLMNVAGAGTISQGLGSLGGAILGRQHFYSSFGGVPGGTPGAKVRPLVYVVCNEFVDVQRAAKHLVNDLKVPLMLGPELSEDTMTIAPNVTVPAGTLLMPTSTSGALRTLQGGLTYRNLANDDDYVPLYQEALKQKETQLKNAAITDGTNLKVAIYFKGDIGGTYLSTLLRQSLTFNGKTAQENVDSGATKLFNFGYSSGMTQAQSDAATAKAVTDVVAFQPHVVLVIGAGETFTGMRSIESGWAASNGALPYKPIYLAYSAASGFNWASWMGIPGNETIRSRLMFPTPTLPVPTDAVGVASRNQAIAEFNANFGVGFQLSYLDNFGSGDAGVILPDSGVDAGPATAIGSLATGAALSMYDNGHLAPLATVSALTAYPDGKITGARLAEALRKFGAGTEFSITSNDSKQPLSDAVANLQKGSGIAWHGITGVIKYGDDGSTRTLIQLRCVGAAPGYATANAGVFYSLAAGAISGTCGGPCAGGGSGGPCW